MFFMFSVLAYLHICILYIIVDKSHICIRSNLKMYMHIILIPKLCRKTLSVLGFSLKPGNEICLRSKKKKNFVGRFCMLCNLTTVKCIHSKHNKGNGFHYTIKPNKV